LTLGGPPEIKRIFWVVKTGDIMRFILGFWVATGFAFIASAQSNVYSLNVVGYVNKPFVAGNTLFANPLSAATNNLGGIFNAAIPNGTTVSLWNAATLSYDVTSTYTGGAWSLNLTLNPGTGALLSSPSVFTNTFVGNVVTRDGGPLGEPPYALPPLYSGPDGLFLMSDVLPAASLGTDIFLNLLGRLPQVGEQVITLSGTSTYLGGNSWSGGTPTLNVAEAVFLNIGPVPVPEPSALALLLLGGALLRWRSRR
jgi:hypothetical protein